MFSPLTPAARQPRGIPVLGASIRRPCAVALPSGQSVITLGNGLYSPVVQSTGTGMYGRPGVRGQSAFSAGGSDDVFRLYSANATNSIWEKPSAAVTVLVYLTRSPGTSSINLPIFGNMSPSTSPYTGWALIDRNDSGIPAFEAAPGGAVTTVFGAQVMPDNAPTVLIGVYNGAAMTIYIDGISQATTSITGSLSYPSGAERGPGLGNFFNYAGGRSFHGSIYLGALWDVALNDSEIARLTANPWCIFAAPRPITLTGFSPSVAAAEAFLTLPPMMPGQWSRL